MVGDKIRSAYKSRAGPLSHWPRHLDLWGRPGQSKGRRWARTAGLGNEVRT